MDQIEGFTMYLSVAEKERLELLHPPEKTPELFEKYLPYAFALDVENEWSEQFAEVLARPRQLVRLIPLRGMRPRLEFSKFSWFCRRSGKQPVEFHFIGRNSSQLQLGQRRGRLLGGGGGGGGARLVRKWSFDGFLRP